MGLYYNPPSPFIGGRQPLEQAKLAPPSGPLPSNPPPLRRLPTDIYAAWWAPQVVVVLPGPFVPLVPPDSPPLPPVRIEALIAAWAPPVPAFQVARNLIPPSGPLPSNPPITGSVVPAAVLVSWIPPPPAFQAARNGTPSSGPVASPPPILGSRIPAAITVSWIPPPPMYQARLPGAPPSGPLPSNPPRMVRVMDIILQAWAPPAPFQMPVFPSPADFLPPTGGASTDVLLRWRRNGRR